MKLPVSSLARGQGLFFAWVILSEHKWVTSRERRGIRIQDRFQDERVDLISPCLVVAEVANVLWKRERRSDLTAAAAQRCFQQFLRDSPILWVFGRAERFGAGTGPGTWPACVRLPLPGLGPGAALRSGDRR
jgi:hypothetical protein